MADGRRVMSARAWLRVVAVVERVRSLVRSVTHAVGNSIRRRVVALQGWADHVGETMWVRVRSTGGQEQISKMAGKWRRAMPENQDGLKLCTVVMHLRQ